MEFARDDIKLSARWPFIFFGDGYMAQVISIVSGKDFKNNDVYKMKIIPDESLAKRYNILVSQLDANLSLAVEYPVEMIKQLNSDPVFTIYFNFLNFKGEECQGTKAMLGKIDADVIMNYRKMINNLRAENAYLSEQLNKAKTNVQRFIKEDIMGPAAEIGAQIALQNQPMQPVGPVRNQ